MINQGSAHRPQKFCTKLAIHKPNYAGTKTPEGLASNHLRQLQRPEQAVEQALNMACDG
jgi:hypothetical protein